MKAKYLPVLIHLGLIALWVFKKYSPNKDHETLPSRSTQFPATNKTARASSTLPKDAWHFEVSYSVPDTFLRPSLPHGHYYSQSRTGQTPVIQVHADIKCPKQSADAKFCMEVTSQLPVVFGPAFELIARYLYTNPPNSSTGDPTAESSPFFPPSVPAVRNINMFLQHFSPEEKEKVIALVPWTFSETKEIFIDLDFLSGWRRDKTGVRNRLEALIMHELVHCYQHHAPSPKTDAPPRGLVEGIAEFVALKGGYLSALERKNRPRWSKQLSKRWDIGYENTAYFLEWLENVRVGQGAVSRINDRLYRSGYTGTDTGGEDKSGEAFWKGLFETTAEELWEEYGKWVNEKHRWDLGRFSSFFDMPDPAMVRVHVILFVLAMIMNRSGYISIASGFLGTFGIRRAAKEQEIAQPVAQPVVPPPEPLPQPVSPPRKPIIIDDCGDKWEVEKILESRLHYRKLQYRVCWAGEGRDHMWYNASAFKHGPQMLLDFHNEHPEMPGPSIRMNAWFKAARDSQYLEDNVDDDKVV